MTRMGSRGVVGLAIAAGVILAGLGTLYALGGHTTHVKQNLTATSTAPNAHGKAKLVVHGSKKGKFTIIATHLQGGKQYDVVVGGIKVGQMQTNTGGSGIVHFSTTPGSKDTLLGFDPRGAVVSVRADDTGDDDLVGNMPDDNNGTLIACCLPQGDNSQGDEQGGSQGNTECEELTAAECMAEGGTPGIPAGTAAAGMPAGTAASCLPNPCSTTPPPGGRVVCCTNATGDDESEAQCTEVATQADCAEMNGSVVQATSCDADPCAAPPPTNLTACCVTHSDDGETETECEVLSSSTCTALSGMPVSGTTCEPNPCPTPSGTPSGTPGGGGDDGGDGGGGSGGGDD